MTAKDSMVGPVYRDRAPLERVLDRAHKLYAVKQGGKLIKVIPTLEPRKSRFGSTYYVRCWHVLGTYPVTNRTFWQRMDWEVHFGKGKLFCCNWNQKPPTCFEILRPQPDGSLKQIYPEVEG